MDNRCPPTVHHRRWRRMQDRRPTPCWWTVWCVVGTDEGGVGVIDTDRTPGGCLAHFSAVEMDGYRKLRPGQHVRLRIEPAQNQDGCFFRAIHVHPLDQT